MDSKKLRLQYTLFNLSIFCVLTLGIPHAVRAESIKKANTNDLAFLLDAASGMNSAYTALLIGETHDRIYIEYQSAIHASSFFSKEPKYVIYWLPKSDITNAQLNLLKNFKADKYNR